MTVMDNEQRRVAAFSIVFFASACGWLIMEQLILQDERVATNVVIEDRRGKYGSGLLNTPGSSNKQTPATAGEPSKPTLTPTQRQQWNSLPQATKDWVKSLTGEQREALKKQYGVK